MFTKKELLQKGISEPVADEIIASYSHEDTDETSLQALEKALNPDTQDDVFENLFKAGGGGSDSDDEGEEGNDYNESYMRKYMRRYMKENKKACSKMMKEMGIMNEEMKKAINDIDLDGEGAVVEMENLSPFLSTVQHTMDTMVKAYSDITEKMEVIFAQNGRTYGLLEKAAKVQVDQANNLSEFMKTPLGRKGITASVATLKKGNDIELDPDKTYRVLMKAVKNKDRTAGQIISNFESSGKRVKFLMPQEKAYIVELLKKEGE